MDCTFSTEEGLFNYRAGAVILREGRLLAMTEEGIPHWYLPGGRVRLHEAMEQAVLRELREELGVNARVVRPLWLCESFFSLGSGPVHEVAMYFLVEPDWAALPGLEGDFSLVDAGGEWHQYRWLGPEEVARAELYPLVLKESFPSLPERLVLVTDDRDRAAWPDNPHKPDATFGQPRPGGEYYHRPGAYLLAVEDGLLAVAQTPKGWFLPGGGVEKGESHAQCIRRECREELGREARPGEYLGCAEAYLVHPRIPDYHAIYYFYTGALGGSLGPPTEPDHCLRLVPVEQAAQKLYLEAQRWAVRRLLGQA